MKLFKFFLNVILAIMLTFSLFGCNKASSTQDSTQSESTDTSSTSDSSSSEYIFPNSDTTLLTESDLSDLSLKNLELARNEIYARHGYIFKTEDLKSYFSQKSWYKEDSSFNPEKDLNTTETKNITLIKSVEDEKNSTTVDKATDDRTYGKIKQVSIENGKEYITFDKVEWLTYDDIKNRQDVKDYLTKQYGSVPTQFDNDYYIYDPDSNLTKLEFDDDGTITNWKSDDSGITSFSISFDDLKNNIKQNDMYPQDGIYAISIEDNTITKLDKMFQP